MASLGGSLRPHCSGKGTALAVFHRGTSAVPAGVDEIRGDHNQLQRSAQELKRFAADVVIDLVISSGTQAEELMNIFRGRADEWSC